MKQFIISYNMLNISIYFVCIKLCLCTLIFIHHLTIFLLFFTFSSFSTKYYIIFTTNFPQIYYFHHIMCLTVKRHSEYSLTHFSLFYFLHKLKKMLKESTEWKDFLFIEWKNLNCFFFFSTIFCLTLNFTSYFLFLFLCCMLFLPPTLLTLHYVLPYIQKQYYILHRNLYILFFICILCLWW